MSPPVFISYARKSSKDQAEALHQELGEDSFLDTTRIEDGAPIPDTLVDALLASKAVVIFAEPTYFERWYCLWELRTVLTPFLELGPRASAIRRNEELRPIVIALPVEEPAQTPLQLPPQLRQRKWPKANETQRLAEEVRRRLAGTTQTLGERITSAGGHVEAIRASLLTESSIPEPMNLAQVKRLFPLEWRQSIRQSFVGRANELWKMDFVLSTMRRELSGAALSGNLVGAGGFGKTRLALEYVHRLGPRNHPGGIFWVDADVSEDRLEEQFHGILRTLRPEASDLATLRKQGRPVAQELAQALHEVARDERILYIVDNVPETAPGQEPRSIGTWCPAPGMVSLLLTSRARLALGDAGIASLPVHALSPEDALALLTEGVPRHPLDEQSWLDITHWVGQLPLALELLNRVLRVQAITPEELVSKARSTGPVRELDRHRESLDGEVSRQEMPGVTQALLISYERLPASTQLAARLLAWLAPDPIPMAVLRELEPEVSASARTTLVSRSLITPVETSAHGTNVPMYGEMHRVIADFLQERPTDKHRELQRLSSALRGVTKADTIHDPKHWPLLSACVPLAERVLQQLGAQGRPASEEELLLAIYIGSFLSRRSLSEHAQRVLESGLARARAALGPRHPLTIWVEAGLAWALHEQGETHRAVALQREALEKSKEVFGEDAPDTLDNLNNLAVFLRAQGRYEEALQLNESAIQSYRRTFGEESRETITAMDNQAVALSAAEEHTRAFQLSQRAAELSRRVLGPDDPDTLKALSNLAAIHQARDELGPASDLHRQVLEARQRVLGRTHRDTLVTMGNLAGVLYALADYEGARKLQEQILETYKKVQGSTHSHTLQVHIQLAGTLHRLGMHHRAQELAGEGLEASRQKFGEAHPATQSVLRQYATVLMNQGEWERAQVHLQQLLGILRQELGEEHVNTINTTVQLALALLNQEDNARARELLERALTIRLRTLGRADPRTLEVVQALNHTFLAQIDHSDTEPGLTKLLEVCIQQFGEPHPQTLQVRTNLAHCFYSQKKLPEAREQFEKVLEARKVALGEKHPETLEAMYLLARALNVQQQFKPAQRLLEEVAATRRATLGETHSDTLEALEGLAFNHQGQGNLAEARAALEPVVAARLRDTSTDHRRTLDLMRFLLGLRSNLGDLDGARELARLLIERQSQLHGETHPRTLHTMEELATLHVQQENYPAAQELLRKLELAREASLGDSHPDTLRAMKFLAWVEQRLGNLKEARELREKLLATHSKLQREEAPETLDAMDGLASVLFTMKRYSEAQQYLERLLPLLRRVFGERHPNTLETMTNLARTLRQQGLTEAADTLEGQLAELRSRSPPEE